MTADQPSAQWWILRSGKAEGPFTPAYIQLNLRSGVIAPEDLACQSGGQQWLPLYRWPEFASSMPPQLHSGSPPVTAELPEFAKWIRYYCLFVSPVLLFGGMVGCVDSGPLFVPESPFFALEFIATVCTWIVQLVAAVILIVGAIGLPTRSTRSVRMLQIGLAVDLVNAVAMLVFMLFLVVLAQSEEGHIAQSQSSVFDLLIPVHLAAFVFEVVAIVWLVRKADAITRPANR